MKCLMYLQVGKMTSVKGICDALHNMWECDYLLMCKHGNDKMLTRMADVTYLFHNAGLCSHACTHICSLHLSHSNIPHFDTVKNRRPIGAVLKNTHIGFTTFPHSRWSLLPFTSNFYLCVLEWFHLNAHHSIDPLCILIAKLKLYLHIMSTYK